MTVRIEPPGAVSDRTPAHATVDSAGVFRLHGIDGARLSLQPACEVLGRIRWATSLEIHGKSRQVGYDLYELTGVDGIGLDRDTAVAILRLVEPITAADPE